MQFKQLEMQQNRGDTMFEPKGCEDQIGPHVKRLSHAIGRLFRKNAGENGLDEATVISGRIMSLIYFSDRDIFQKDVEDAFHINRSSVTSAVKLMEKKGYITRQPVSTDARLKKLKLTDEGIKAHKAAVRAMRQTEETAASCLTAEERRIFIELCDRITAAVENSETEAGTR